VSLQRDGTRPHKQIAYDDAFLKATFPSTRKGTALVEPGVGVRINYLEYWCEAMRDARVEGTQVPVRYDPFDVSVGYAYLLGLWRTCSCPYTEFAGCSERELHLLTQEVRQRNRLHAGRAHTEVTQKQLAVFRRENAGIEAILRQQRRDRETRAALTVLEGGKASVGLPHPAATDQPGPHGAATTPARPGALSDQLLVFRRIEL
jgi:putative transposase